MIQPISTSDGKSVFNGVNGLYKTPKRAFTAYAIPLIKSCAVASATGGVITLLSRNYTRNWAQAGALGILSSFLAMFFMSPQIIDKSGLAKSALAKEADMLIKDETYKMAGNKNFLKSVKKMIPFKQQS